MTEPQSDQPLDRQSITPGFILLTYSLDTHLTLDHLASENWEEVGAALASLPHLQTLSILRCSANDALSVKLCQSKSITSLSISTCCQHMQRSAASPNCPSHILQKWGSCGNSTLTSHSAKEVPSTHSQRASLKVFL